MEAREVEPTYTLAEMRAAIKELEQREDLASKIAASATKKWVERQLTLDQPIFLAQALQKMNEAMDDAALAGEDGLDGEDEADSILAGIAVRNAAEAWLMLEWREGFPESHVPVASAFPDQKREPVAFMPLSLLPALPNSRDEQISADSFIGTMVENAELEAALMQLPHLGQTNKYELVDENIEYLRRVLRAARKWGAYQRKILGLDPIKEELVVEESADGGQHEEPLEIRGYAHCVKCIKEKPRDQSPAEWARYAVGSTMAGIQVWCMRHNCSIVHVQYKPYIAALELALKGAEQHEHGPDCEHDHEEPMDQPEPPSDELLYAVKELGATIEAMKEDLEKGITDPANTYEHVIELYGTLEPIFWAISQFAKVMAQKGELGCHDCGRKYSLGPDLVVSDEDWAVIAPKPDGGGVLCPNCMHDRFVQVLGDKHKAGNIRAVFTSGPFATEKPTPTNVLWERIRLLRLAIMEEQPTRGSALDAALNKDLALWKETEDNNRAAHA